MDQVNSIIIKGARENNLKNLNISIPSNQYVCVTGVSGCGKSSLIYDTLYAESQRVFFDSMSINPYGQRLLEKPDVDSIMNLRPAISLSQNTYNTNPRSTLGTVTELSHYVRGIFALLSQGGYKAKDFSFNNPSRFCPRCKGLGEERCISMSMLIPDDAKSLAQGAISYFGNHQGSYERQLLIAFCSHKGIDLDVPFNKLPQKMREAVLYERTPAKYDIKYKTPKGRYKKASAQFVGAYTQLQKELEHIETPSVLARIQKYLETRQCSVCNGQRLSDEMLQMRVMGMNIAEVEALPLNKLSAWTDKLHKTHEHTAYTRQINMAADFILQKLNALIDLRIGYLSLCRTVPSLSVGEMQRVRIASHLTSPLIGLLYIFDEPCKGLHHRDIGRIISATERLVEKGNTVIAIEHNKRYIASSEYMIELGPQGGPGGGYIIRECVPEKENAKNESTTFKTGPTELKQFLRFEDIRLRNIQHETVGVPIGAMTCITGVSGSGKSTLSKVIEDCVRSAAPTHCASVENAALIKSVSFVNQSPIGKTPRSTVVSYLGIYDHIRDIFAATTDAMSEKIPASCFSMNVPGGRCEACQGTGKIKTELEYMPDVYLTCDACGGKRFADYVLEIKKDGMNIYDVLMSEAESLLSFFQESPSVSSILSCLVKIGLGYIKLGQPSMSISGGEAQRIKLAKALGMKNTGNRLFILDEPTNGLADKDTEKISTILNGLVASGNTVVIIEHNLEFIMKNADYLIDLGRFGGDEGGKIVFQGAPSEVFAHPDTSWYGLRE